MQADFTVHDNLPGRAIEDAKAGGAAQAGEGLGGPGSVADGDVIAGDREAAWKWRPVQRFDVVESRVSAVADHLTALTVEHHEATVGGDHVVRGMTEPFVHADLVDADRWTQREVEVEDETAAVPVVREDQEACAIGPQGIEMIGVIGMGAAVMAQVRGDVRR